MFRAVCVLLLTASSWAASPSDLAIAALLPPHLKKLARAPIGVDLDFVAVIASAQAPTYSWDTTTKLGLFLQSRTTASQVYRLAILDGHPAGQCLASAVYVSTGEFILGCQGKVQNEVFHERFLYDLTTKSLRGSVRSSQLAIERLEVQHDHIAFTASNGESYSFLADAPSTLFRAQLSAPSFRFGARKNFTLERSARKGVWSITERSAGKPQFHPFPPDDYLHAPESIGPWQIYDGDLYFATTFPEPASGKGAFGRFNTGTRSYEMQAPEELKASAATAIFVDGSQVYLGFRDRVVIVDRGSNRLRQIPAPSAIHAIVSHNGRLYLGTARGLAILSGEQWITYFIHPDGPQLLEQL